MAVTSSSSSQPPAASQPGHFKRLWTYLRPELSSFILAMVAMGVVAATEGSSPRW